MIDDHSQVLSAKDFQWGAEVAGIRIGLWSGKTSTKVEGHVQLRAAVRNLTEYQIEIENCFGLAIDNGKEVFEHFGGPRSTTSILVKRKEFREILGWRLGDEISLDTGSYQCWVIYRPKDGEEVHSQAVSLEVHPPVNGKET
jgi:hypothetical protein